jgi:xylulokinase
VNSESFWLVIDIGTSAAKAALMTTSGEISRSLSRTYRTDVYAGGVIEQQAEDWWNAVLDAIKSLDAQKVSLQGVVLTGQMQNIILTHADGQPLRPVILYSDTRAQTEAAEIQQRITQKRLRTLTGNDQGADSLLAKALWLQRHEPSTLHNAHKLLIGAADYIALKLTGVSAADTTTASTTGLVRLHQRAWLDDQFFADAGLANLPRLLPKLVLGGTRVGNITASAASTSGLREGLPIYLAPGDAGAATLGVGSGESGQAYGYLGTSGWIAFSDQAVGSPEQGVLTLLHPRDGWYIPVAPLLTAGGNLEWMVRQMVGQHTVEIDYGNLIEQAIQRQITPLIYLPYLNGERAPFSDPLARAAFIGINANTETLDLLRAALEGICFAYQHALDALLAQYPTTLILAGGGTRTPALSQLFADILGLNVAIVSDSEHVGLRGALLSMLVANGYFENYRPTGFFPSPVAIQPNMQHHEHYAQKYQIFRAAYPALKPIFTQQAALWSSFASGS